MQNLTPGTRVTVNTLGKAGKVVAVNGLEVIVETFDGQTVTAESTEVTVQSFLTEG